MRISPTIQAKVEEPVSYNYRGYRPQESFASQGPAELLALSILQGYDLKNMGHNSADYIHTLAEATKLAMADRDKYLGDMDFIKIPYRGLAFRGICRASARKLIDPAKASLELRPGTAGEIHAGVHARRSGRTTTTSPARAIMMAIPATSRSSIAAAQCCQLYAQPAQRIRHQDRDGRSGFYLELPRRLLFARGRSRQRARAGQTAAQHAARHAGDEGRRDCSWSPDVRAATIRTSTPCRRY